MKEQKSVTIPQPVYDRIQRLAHLRQQEVNELLVGLLTAALGAAEAKAISRNGHGAGAAENPTDRDIAAYIALHARLREKYENRYIAIHQGQVIDVDADPLALYQRVDERLPDEFVWMSQVTEEPLRTLHFRSLR